MKYLQCHDWPFDIKYNTYINNRIITKCKACYDWPPDYIEETPIIIKKTQIKFINKVSGCSWHNEKEIYCKNVLNWNISSGHCF
tara:strand:+ start:301 stop:552 length:252 start_codon:yes stop_codon:yes gene_type:complete